jgi:hypothetical protein
VKLALLDRFQQLVLTHVHNAKLVNTPLLVLLNVQLVLSIPIQRRVLLPAPHALTAHILKLERLLALSGVLMHPIAQKARASTRWRAMLRTNAKLKPVVPGII